MVPSEVLLATTAGPELGVEDAPALEDEDPELLLPQPAAATATAPRVATAARWALVIIWTSIEGRRLSLSHRKTPTAARIFPFRPAPLPPGRTPRCPRGRSSRSGSSPGTAGGS